MRIQIYLILILIFSGALFADVKLRRVAQDISSTDKKFENAVVAILPFEHLSQPDSSLGHQLSEDLTVELLRVQKYKISERSQVTRVLNQLALHQTGLIEEKLAKKIGNALGARCLVVGTISEQNEGYVKLNIRLIDIETFAVLAASSITFNPEQQVKIAEKAENFMHLNSIDVFAGIWNFSSDYVSKETSYLGEITKEYTTSRYTGRSKMHFGLRYQYAFGYFSLAITGEYSAAGLLGVLGGLLVRVPLYEFSSLPIGTHYYFGFSAGYADAIIYRPVTGFSYAVAVDVGVFGEIQYGSTKFSKADYDLTLSGASFLAGVRYHPE